MNPKPPLTNLQRELVDLFALQVPEDDLREIKRMLARYFATKATDEMDRFCGEQGLTADDLEHWSHEHERADTDRS